MSAAPTSTAARPTRSSTRTPPGVVLSPQDPSLLGSANPRLLTDVDGTLYFEREVELFVHDSAKIGNVRGATAKRFSGNQP